MGPFYLLIAIAVLIAFYLISIYNQFATLGNKVDEAFATMDVYLKKRYDLIPNLVETVKGYAKHESETLENVVSARNKALSSATPADKAAAEKEFAGTLSRLLALTEAYPDLKANQNFLSLQSELVDTENKIQSARRFYNNVAKDYNILIESIPTNIFAKLFNHQKKPLLEISIEEAKNINVKF